MTLIHNVIHIQQPKNKGNCQNKVLWFLENPLHINVKGSLSEAHRKAQKAHSDTRNHNSNFSLLNLFCNETPVKHSKTTHLNLKRIF